VKRSHSERSRFADGFLVYTSYELSTAATVANATQDPQPDWSRIPVQKSEPSTLRRSNFEGYRKADEDSIVERFTIGASPNPSINFLASNDSKESFVSFADQANPSDAILLLSVLAFKLADDADVSINMIKNIISNLAI
jgi:hypothetical protein